ncbi:hypothetical protein JCM10908_000021 [Rhodotorula pacifica]|uniref:uncharacterized protein n=1 Tax=Rhodotorula pacifica TaxID=1495444 RepID=UPI0031734CC7
MGHSDPRGMAMHRVVKRQQEWAASQPTGSASTSGGGGSGATTTQAAWQQTTTSQWTAPSSSSAAWSASSSQPEWKPSSSSTSEWQQPSSSTTNNWQQPSSSAAWSSSTQAWQPSTTTTSQWWPSSSSTQAWSSSQPAWSSSSSSSSTLNWWDSTSSTQQAWSSSTSQWQQATSSATSSATTTSAAGPATFTSHSTAVVTVDQSASALSASNAANSLAAHANRDAANGGSNKLATGAVAGIVVGAVVVLAAVAGGVFWLLKKKMRDNDPDMISPFDRDAFRRASVMLDNGDDDDEFGTDSYRNAAGAGYTSAGGAGGRGMHSPHMSEYSMQSLTGAVPLAGAAAGAGAAGGLSRSDTTGAPMQYYHQQQPAFDPSQVVPVMAPPPAATAGGVSYSVPGYAPYPHAGLAPSIPAGDYDAAAAALGAYPTLNRGPSQVSRNGATLSVAAAADLSRRDSRASEYSQYSDGPGPDLAIPPVAASRGPYNTDERGLPLVHEVEEPYTPPSATNKRFANFQREQLEQRQHQQQYHQYQPSVAGATHNGSEYQERSGTPENANVQQTFFTSSQSQYLDAIDSHPSLAGLAGGGPPAYLPDGEVAHIGRSWSAEAGDEGDYNAAASSSQNGGNNHRRRLSVRNGGLDDFAEEGEDDGEAI